ncbi:MAG: UbiD family decarboxylase [Chloroflexi bacterium]|nr:UbiD family decarboxylase [Chloroflexota bacterium]
MKDFRSLLKEYEEKFPEEFIRVKKPVDPQYEVTAIVRKLAREHRYPVLFFENMRGSEYPLATLVYTTHKRFAYALGTEPDKIEETYIKAEEATLADWKSFTPIEIRREESPVKEIVLSKEQIDLSKFPFVIHHIDEQPTITTAIGISRDPDTGLLHAGHYRLKTKGKDQMTVAISGGRHLWYIYRNALRRGQSLPMAFSIGNHPAWAMGAQSRIAHPPTEFEVIGTLMGEPLRMVRCENSDLLVPANAEMIIEGELRAEEREWEPPFWDWTGYEHGDLGYPFHLTAITHRQKPILHDFGEWIGLMDIQFGLIPQRLYAYRQIKTAVPSVVDFRLAFRPSTVWGLISMHKMSTAEPKQAIIAAIAAEMYLKYVIVVDDDINLDNYDEIFWAMATRVKNPEDIMILPGMMASDTDISSSTEPGVVTKMGIDATAKPFRKDYPALPKVPKEVMARIDLKELLG